MINLSEDQKLALKVIIDWYQQDRLVKQYITLGGYAGTGKTTLIAKLRQKLEQIDPDLKVGFASYTGKASRVLKNKLKEQQVVAADDSVSTIHSLIYSPLLSDKGEIIGWETKESLDRDLIIIDEASMVDEIIWHHLLAYKIPIIAVGDHGQLPPIQGRFNLMEQPDLTLEEIHRQAKENPIIGLSIQARKSGHIQPGKYSKGVRKFSLDDIDGQETLQDILQSYNPNTLILCGYNHTRKKLNNSIRASLGFESEKPESGDRVICLRNNHQQSIYNGMLGTIKHIESRDEDWYFAEISMDGEESEYQGLIAISQFNSDTPLNFTEKRTRFLKGDLFDFGYALTVHKAQGSQAKKVILFEERFSKMDDEQWKRWLYTGVTRAEEELYIFSR